MKEESDSGQWTVISGHLCEVTLCVHLKTNGLSVYAICLPMVLPVNTTISCICSSGRQLPSSHGCDLPESGSLNSRMYPM